MCVYWFSHTWNRASLQSSQGDRKLVQEKRGILGFQSNLTSSRSLHSSIYTENICAGDQDCLQGKEVGKRLGQCKGSESFLLSCKQTAACGGGWGVGWVRVGTVQKSILVSSKPALVPFSLQILCPLRRCFPREYTEAEAYKSTLGGDGDENSVG